jgi:ABC-2 type transport system ATP-binding protein
MIEVENLARRYGDFQAVADVSFAIAPGEVVGLLGHNGAGKTTIMKMLTGYLEPSAGHARIDGLDVVADRQAVQGLIGYLPENCPVYPEMTVIDYLDYQAGLHGMPDAERPAAIRQAIDRTWLQDKALDAIGTLSRGYRQRVGVAQAILHSPHILILDEPTNGLDPTQIQQMRQLIRELAKTSTVILSTHILQEVQAVCDRVLVMRRGQLVLDARLDELARERRLLVTLDAAPAEAEPVLAGIEGIGKVTHLGGVPGRQRYALGLNAAASAATAHAVAYGAINSGLELYELHAESRDLETLFRELNESTVTTQGQAAVQPEAAHA